MHRLNALRWIVALLFLGTGGLAGAEPNRHALLIGCSQYLDEQIDPLPGAANDVAQFRKLLAENFGFEQIDTLVGWPEDERQRPTCANIVATVDRLVARAEAGSHVVLLFSGHGSRFPVPDSQEHLLDPRNPEPDGFDEAFLAADYRAATNMILDDQVGRWLDQLKSKGAHVWIIFDSCFSGTMMRGGKENPRRVDSRVAGIPADAIDAARRRSAQQSQVTKSRLHDGLDVPASPSDSRGSVVAFYAAQDFQTAPEVPRPPEADPTPHNTRGLLSFHLQQLLQQSAEQLTYRELGRMLVGRYRSERGSRDPTPCFEGDLDQEVFGLQKWPELNPLILETDVDRLAAGSLAGLTTGTVLSVHPPDDIAGTKLLGHIRLTSVSATASAFEIVDGQQAVEAVLDRARCRVVRQDLGAMRVKLAVLHPDEARWREIAGKFKTELVESPGEDRSIVQLVDRAEDADWLLTMPAPASDDATRDSADTSLSVSLVPSHQSHPSRRVERRYPLTASDRLAASVAHDLSKIASWENLWRIAAIYDKVSTTSPARSVELDVAQLREAEDRSRGIPLTSNRVQVGDCYVVRVVNHSSAPQWYTVLFLNGRYGIEFVTSGALAPRGAQGVDSKDRPFEREVERLSIASNAFGVEGYLVIAVSQRQHRNEPNYRFLAQSALGEPGKRASANVSQLTTPFEQLLLQATQGLARTRSGVSPDDPHLDTWSWTPLTVAED